MAKFWTVPEPCEATRWFPQMGILKDTEGWGCWVCGMNPCSSNAHHEPIAHPHHLEVQTWRGPAIIFPGDWLVIYPDRRVERFTNQEFSARFSSDNPAQSERPDQPVSAGRLVAEAAVEFGGATVTVVKP